MRHLQGLIGGLVAPFTGAWIEIVTWLIALLMMYVAPFTGAWIEIFGHEHVRQ